MDWVLPTNEVLATFALRRAGRSDGPVPHSDEGRKNSIALRLRKFAARLAQRQ